VLFESIRVFIREIMCGDLWPYIIPTHTLVFALPIITTYSILPHVHYCIIIIIIRGALVFRHLLDDVVGTMGMMRLGVRHLLDDGWGGWSGVGWVHGVGWQVEWRCTSWP
jgi:hypothetical protein